MIPLPVAELQMKKLPYQKVYEKYGYVVDPHTACGFAETIMDLLLYSQQHIRQISGYDRKIDRLGSITPSLESLKQSRLLSISKPEAIKQFMRDHL